MPSAASAANPSNIVVTLAANYETVMFSFDPVNDIDLDYYEYQIFTNPSGTGNPLNSITLSNGDKISGTNKATVFTVSVANSTSSATTSYWGRARVVSTSGARGAYSALAGSGNTPLIASQFIQNLTADKIEAGTIGAHTISLSGVNSILQSSTFNGTFNSSTGRWNTGTQGWLIAGNGQAIFDATQIRGSLTASSISLDANNYWLPSTVGPPSTPTTFKLGDANKFMEWNGTNLLVNGSTIAGISTTNNKIFIGTGNYNNADTAFYVDSSGNFSLKNKLSWNGTTLQIDGTVTIGGTTASTVVSGAASGASAVQPAGVNANVTSISGGVISTGTINLQNVNVRTGTTGARLNIDSDGIKIYNSSGTNTVSLNSDGSASFSGTLSGATGSFTGALSGATGSVGADFSIGNNLVIGNNVRINGAAGDSGKSIVKIRADSEGTNSLNHPLLVVNFTNENLFRVRRDGRIDMGKATTGGTDEEAEVFVNGSLVHGSDIRFKKDISSTLLGLNFINRLEPVQYYLKSQTTPYKHEGFIAQDVKKVLDLIGVKSSIWKESDEKESYQYLNYQEFIAPLVKAVQELSAKVDELESRLV
jgi:hypothetical protein